MGFKANSYNIYSGDFRGWVYTPRPIAGIRAPFSSSKVFLHWVSVARGKWQELTFPYLVRGSGAMVAIVYQ